MRPPTKRDQCQDKLDILIEGFMRADWTAYRDAAAWLRDFADQKNIERGRVMCGGNWFSPQQIEAVREERASVRQGPPIAGPAHPRNRHTQAAVRCGRARQAGVLFPD
jgi:hypothetical protein